MALTAATDRLVEVCTEELGGTCFCRLPTVDEERFRIATSKQGRVTLDHYRFVDLSAGAPTQKLSSANDPPDFLHVQLLVGALSEDGGLLTVMEKRARTDDTTTVPKNRRTVLSFGDRTWGGHEGELLLATPYPRGGSDADHLLFHFRDAGQEVAVTLHAWLPLEESIQTLQAIVESLQLEGNACA